VVGFLILLVTERDLSWLPKGTSWINRTVNTLFLSVTPRTAGLVSLPTDG